MIEMRALVLAALVVPAIAHADEWQTKAQGAVKVERHEDFVWALTAACDGQRDDTQQRQCRITRDRKLKTLGGTVWITGDAGAVQTVPWNGQKRSVAVTVNGCVHCEGIEVDGKRWSIVGGAGARLDGAKLRGGTLYDNAKPFADEAAATAWLETLAGARFELLVKSGKRSQIAGKDVIAVDIVAWRVVNICDGSIVLSSVPSSRGDPDKVACRALAGGASGVSQHKPSNPVADELPESLSATMVKDAMRPVVDAARKCAATMKQSGRVKLELVINGDGTIAKHVQTGDFPAGTPMAKCIDDAARTAVFPKTKKPSTKIGFPIVLQ